MAEMRERYFWLADRFLAATARSWRANPVLPYWNGLIATCPGLGVYKSGEDLYTVPDLGLDREKLLDVVAWCIQNLSTKFKVRFAHHKEDLLEPPAYLPVPPTDLPEKVRDLARYVDDPEPLYDRIFAALSERFKGRAFGFGWQVSWWEVVEVSLQGVVEEYVDYSSRNYDARFCSDGWYYYARRMGDGRMHHFGPKWGADRMILDLYQSLIRGELLKEAADILIEAAME